MYLVYFESYIEFENCYHGVNNSSIIFNQTKSKHVFFAAISVKIGYVEK